jgi:hypothetical protein
MAVVTVKSTVVTNATATPRVINNPHLQSASVRACSGLATMAATDESGSTYRVFRVRSNEMVFQLVAYALDIGTTVLADIGLYQTSDNGGAVADVDFFATAVSFKDGAVLGTDLTFEAAANNGVPANGEKRIWEAVGLSADPGIEYDVVLTTAANTDAAGVVCIRALVVS